MTQEPKSPASHAENLELRRSSTLVNAMNAASVAFATALKDAIDRQEITPITAAEHNTIYAENVFEVPAAPRDGNYTLPSIPASEQDFRTKLAIASSISSKLLASRFNAAHKHSPDSPEGEPSHTVSHAGKNQTAIIEAYIAAETAFGQELVSAAAKGRR